MMGEKMTNTGKRIKNTQGRWRISGLFCILIFVLACRSTDKATAICEENNNACHRACNSQQMDFLPGKLATQSVSPCDQRCEKNYQACLVRQKDKNIRGLSQP